MVKRVSVSRKNASAWRISSTFLQRISACGQASGFCAAKCLFASIIRSSPANTISPAIRFCRGVQSCATRTGWLCASGRLQIMQFRLQAVKLRIATVQLKQVAMGAVFGDGAVFQIEYAIRIAHAGEAVGD